MGMRDQQLLPLKVKNANRQDLYISFLTLTQTGPLFYLKATITCIREFVEFCMDVCFAVFHCFCYVFAVFSNTGLCFPGGGGLLTWKAYPTLGEYPTGVFHCLFMCCFVCSIVFFFMGKPSSDPNANLFNLECQTDKNGCSPVTKYLIQIEINLIGFFFSG